MLEGHGNISGEQQCIYVVICFLFVYLLYDEENELSSYGCYGCW